MTTVAVEKFDRVRTAIATGEPAVVVVMVAAPYPFVAEKLKLRVPPLLIFLSCRVGSLLLVIAQVSSAPLRMLPAGIVNALLAMVALKLAGFPEFAAFASVQTAVDPILHPPGTVSVTVVAVLVAPSRNCVPVAGEPLAVVVTLVANVPDGPFVME